MPNVFTLQASLSGANISPAPPHCGEGEEEEEKEEVVEEGPDSCRSTGTFCLQQVTVKDNDIM